MDAYSFYENEPVRHVDGRKGMVGVLYPHLQHTGNVLVEWEDGCKEVVRASLLRHHHIVVDATSEDIRRLELVYGKTVDELAAEAEAGYNPDDDMRRCV